MYLEDMVLEFMKVVSLSWIWIQTNDYTDQADSIDKHIDLQVRSFDDMLGAGLLGGLGDGVIRKVVSLPWI